MSDLNSVVHEDYGNNFRVLKRNDQTCELQTIIRDKYVCTVLLKSKMLFSSCYYVNAKCNLHYIFPITNF